MQQAGSYALEKADTVSRFMTYVRSSVAKSRNDVGVDVSSTVPPVILDVPGAPTYLCLFRSILCSIGIAPTDPTLKLFFRALLEIIDAFKRVCPANDKTDTTKSDCNGISADAMTAAMVNNGVVEMGAVFGPAELGRTESDLRRGLRNAIGRDARTAGPFTYSLDVIALLFAIIMSGTSFALSLNCATLNMDDTAATLRMKPLPLTRAGPPRAPVNVNLLNMRSHFFSILPQSFWEILQTGASLPAHLLALHKELGPLLLTLGRGDAESSAKADELVARFVNYRAPAGSVTALGSVSPPTSPEGSPKADSVARQRPSASPAPAPAAPAPAAPAAHGAPEQTSAATALKSPLAARAASPRGRRAAKASRSRSSPRPDTDAGTPPPAAQIRAYVEQALKAAHGSAPVLAAATASASTPKAPPSSPEQASAPAAEPEVAITVPASPAAPAPEPLKEPSVPAEKAPAAPAEVSDSEAVAVPAPAPAAPAPAPAPAPAAIALPARRREGLRNLPPRGYAPAPAPRRSAPRARSAGGGASRGE
jgi:hypothetical protein